MGYYKQVKDAWWDRIEANQDQFMLKIRKKYEKRWMELSGTDDPEKIDLDNPIINLEYFLADFRIIARLTGGKRNEVLEMMTEQQR